MASNVRRCTVVQVVRRRIEMEEAATDGADQS